jgi:hypothetical protein
MDYFPKHENSESPREVGYTKAPARRQPMLSERYGSLWKDTILTYRFCVPTR